MRVVVSTCDKYDHLLPGFAMQWNRYWGIPVTVLGFRQPPPLPENFTFVSMAPEETESWSSHVRRAIKDIDDDQIIFLFDDYWLIEPIDQARIERASAWMQNPGVVKVDLSRNTTHFAHKNVGKHFVEADPNAQYRTSTQPAIWDKSYLLSLLGTGEWNPWQFELQHNPEVARGRIIGTHEQLVPFANIYYKGSPAQYMIDLILPEDLAELHASGALDQIHPHQ